MDLFVSTLVIAMLSALIMLVLALVKGLKEHEAP